MRKPLSNPSGGDKPRKTLYLRALPLLAIAFSGPAFCKLGPEMPDYSDRNEDFRSRFSAEATLFHSSVHIAEPSHYRGHDARNFQLFLDGRLGLGERAFLEARLPYQILNREIFRPRPFFGFDTLDSDEAHDEWESGFGDFEARLDILVRRWGAGQDGLALVGGVRLPTLDSDFPKLDKLEYYPESNGPGIIMGYRFSKSLPGIPVRVNFRNAIRFHPFGDSGPKTGAKLDYVLGLNPVFNRYIEGFELKLHGTFANMRNERDSYTYRRSEDAYNDAGHALKLQPSYAVNAWGAFPVRLGTSLPVHGSADSYVGEGWNVFLSFQFKGRGHSR